jgi:hypothetical protein
MKCPKCSYTTFDYLDTCPRCGKDMTAEKAKLNISSIKPKPPFLLGSLTGDLSDSSVGIPIPEDSEGVVEEMKLKDEKVYDDGSELDINMEEESLSEPGKPRKKVVEEFDLGDLDLSEDDQDMEMEFIPDTGGPEIEEVAVEEEEATKDEKSIPKIEGDKKDVKAKAGKKDVEELNLDVEDLDLELDLEGDSEEK